MVIQVQVHQSHRDTPKPQNNRVISALKEDPDYRTRSACQMSVRSGSGRIAVVAVKHAIHGSHQPKSNQRHSLREVPRREGSYAVDHVRECEPHNESRESWLGLVYSMSKSRHSILVRDTRRPCMSISSMRRRNDVKYRLRPQASRKPMPGQ